MVFLQLRVVGSRTAVETVGPGMAHELDEIVVALLILGKENEVPSTGVKLPLFLIHRPACTVHLTSKNRLEIEVWILLVHFLHIIEELFDTKHVSMVGDCHARHAISNGLIDQLTDFCLAVEHRILGVDMKMYETHTDMILDKKVCRFCFLNIAAHLERVNHAAPGPVTHSQGTFPAA